MRLPVLFRPLASRELEEAVRWPSRKDDKYISLISRRFSFYPAPLLGGSRKVGRAVLCTPPSVQITDNH